MKIAVFIKSTTYHTGHGGFEVQNKLLCEGLVRRGHKVVVYAPKKELKTLYKAENGVAYKFIECKFGNFKTLYSGSNQSWEMRSVAAFIEDHKRDKYSVVLGQSSWALPLIRKKSYLGVKVISILHGTKIGEYQTQLKNVKTLKELLISLRDIPHVMRTFFGSQREFVQGSDKLIAVSNFVKSAIIDETFVDERKIEVIHNGVDDTKYADIKNKVWNSASPVKLIYIGRVIRAKGLYVLIDALAKLTNSNWELSVIGEGEALEDLKSTISAKGLEDKIKCFGAMKYDKVLEELWGADIFILPSLRLEGLPMTIVEAMFSGLPCVVSDIGGNSDAVINNETGFLIKPGKVSDLALKIDDLIANPEKRKLLGTNARNRAEKQFTIDKMLDAYERVIKGVSK